MDPSTGINHWRLLASKGGIGPTGKVSFNLNSGVRLLNSDIYNYIDFGQKTAYECVITGNDVYISFSGVNCNIGETTLLKIKHSGAGII